MAITILRARWASADGSAAIITTTHAGDVLATADRAPEWAALQDWIGRGRPVAPALASDILAPPEAPP